MIKRIFILLLASGSLLAFDDIAGAIQDAVYQLVGMVFLGGTVLYVVSIMAVMWKNSRKKDAKERKDKTKRGVLFLTGFYTALLLLCGVFFLMAYFSF